MPETYTKKCRYCGKEFTTEIKNLQYCSDKCCKKHLSPSAKQQKAREKQRTESRRAKPILSMISAGYSLAHKVADYLELPKECCCSSLGDCSGDFELHHLDGNPLNNDPRNLVYACKRHHIYLDNAHPSVNFQTAHKELKKLSSSTRVIRFGKILRGEIEGRDSNEKFKEDEYTQNCLTLANEYVNKNR